MRSTYLFIIGSLFLLVGCTLVPNALPAAANGAGAGLVTVGAALYALVAGRALNAEFKRDTLQMSVDRVERVVYEIKDKLPEEK